MRVRDNLRVSPPYATLFNSKDNFLDVLVLHGSGSFEIASNDTRTVRFAENAFDSLRVWPLRLGRASITVRDRLQAGSEPVESIVDVVEVAKLVISLDSPLILLNSQTTARVHVLDSTGRNFSLNQYRHMNISLSVEAESEFSTQSTLKFERDSSCS